MKVTIKPTTLKKEVKSTSIKLNIRGQRVSEKDHSKLTNLDYEHSGHTGFQAEIEDLDEIRSGAEAGATAVQDEDYVHTDNNYTDEEKEKLDGLENYDDTEIRQDLANKVDKVSGKGLSTNDYTTVEKNKLANLSNYDDTEVKADITAIESKIPDQATAQNKLADKDFVNSSIATNTAYFKGTYESTSELPTTGVTNNDYAFIVIYDTEEPTQVKQYDRYKYNGSAWVYEYTLNNSSFTAQQWASIQSGITSGLVEKLQGIATGAQVNVLEGIKVQGVEQTISNKEVDLDVATTEQLEELINWQEATGKEISIDNALEYKLKSLELSGDSEQNSTTGKQLIPFINQDFTLKGVRYYVQNGKLYMNGTSQGETTTSNSNFRNNFSFILPAGTYYIKRSLLSVPFSLNKKSDNSSIRNTEGTFTLQEETEVYLGFYIYNKVFNNDLIDNQVNIGTTATPYEPYTGGIPSPNPDYPQTIHNVKSSNGVIEWKKTGKNLLNISAGISKGITTIKNIDGSISATGTTTSTWFCYGNEVNYNLNAGTYTFSIQEPLSHSIRINSYDSNNNLTRIIIMAGSLSAQNTFTTNQVRYNIENPSATPDTVINETIKLQLEEGSTATPFEPHKSVSVPFNIGTEEFCKLPNNVADKLWVNMKTGEYGKTANVGKVVLDGSENWYLHNQDVGQFRMNLQGLTNNPILNNYFQYKLIYVTTGKPYLRPGIDDIWAEIGTEFLPEVSVNAWKTWLSTHNTIVQYELATPVTTTLGTLSQENLSKLKTYAGTNNITITGCDDITPDIDMIYPTKVSGGGNVDDVKVNGTSVVTNKVASIDLTGKQDITDKVTSISNDSTNQQYPSAKAVYDYIESLDIEEVDF